MAHDTYLPNLAGVGDVGTAVGLGVEALYLHDPNAAYPLWHQIDLGTDEVGIGEHLFTFQLVDPDRTLFGEGLVSRTFDLTDHLGGPLAGKREIHPGAVFAHLAARDPGVAVAPDHTGKDVQRRVVSHVGEPPPPFQRALQIPHGIRDGSFHDVDDLSTLSPRVHDRCLDGTDAKGPLVRRLSSTTGIEGGPVKYHLTAFQPYDVGFELLCVGVFQEELFGHSGRVPRSWFLKVATSR